MHKKIEQLLAAQVETYGNRHPEFRHAGYSGGELLDTATSDQVMAFKEGVEARELNTTIKLAAPSTSPATTGWDNGLMQDYDKNLSRALSEKLDAREVVRSVFPVAAPSASMGTNDLYLAGYAAGKQAAPSTSLERHCACVFVGDVNTEQCKLHAAWCDTLHEQGDYRRELAALKAAPSTSQDMDLLIEELTHTAACYHDYSSLRQRIADVVSAHIKGGA